MSEPAAPPASPTPELARLTGPSWRLVAGGIVLLGLVLATELYVWLNLWPLRVSWGTALVWSLPQLYFWILLLPPAALLIRRRPIAEGHGGRLAFHVVVSVLFSLTALTLVDLSDRVIHWSRWLGAPGSLVANIRYTVVHLHFGVAVYWVLFAAIHAVGYYRGIRERDERAARLEAELVRSQLDALRAQLRPHFLFNTLNSIAVLLRHDPAAAERVVQQLGRLLRATLEYTRQEVALEDEVALVQEYLAIEKARFRERLDVRFEVDEAAHDAAVPHLLLQPLLENAVQHAIAPRSEPGQIRVRIRRAGPRVEITVADDGPGIRVGAAAAGSGIGLANTRKRLETLYGADQRLELLQAPEGGLEVRIVIPYRPAGRPAG